MARTGSGRGDPLPWRILLRTVLVPNLLHASGQGALIPAIPLAVIGAGGAFADAAIVAAMLTVGQLATTLPAGWLVNRVGEKATMIASLVMTVIGSVVAAFADSIPHLVIGTLLVGAGVAIFTMARHAWITVSVPRGARGRALSLVSGFNRLGALAGPFIAAGVLALTSDAAVVFLVVAGLSAALLVIVGATRFPDRGGEPIDGEAPGRVLVTMWEQRAVLLQLGSVASIISAMRTTRRILIPLFGIALGFSDVSIALIIAVAASIDFSLFYVGGSITDRAGRLWVAIPTLTGFAVGHVILGLCTLLPGGSWWFMASVLIMAVANGISGGIVATMGSDLAHPRTPAAFLSSWRLMTEIGPSLVPFAIAAVTATISLGAAAGVVGALAFVGLLVLPGRVRRFLPRHPDGRPY